MEHKIEILSSQIANKIAAGEVVQRPLSVVKELVENSIDANSKTIKINLKNSGLDQIQVIDDGIGMSLENVNLCLVRHATSKVKSEHDIYKIMTLGFRGEALPSIAAVSIFNLKTSIDGTLGYELIKEGDEEQQVKETSTNKGTNISVSNLFFNTPARFKHLSSTFYELSLIVQYVNKAALTNPFIKFELKNNDNVIFNSLGDGNIKNVMQKIYNTEIAKNIINFKTQNDDFEVDFYIVKPQITRAKKTNMHIGVNDRIIKNMAIENMIIKGYGTYLHTNQYPIVFLNIKTDFSLIDINIHPTKEQIKISLIDSLEQLIVNSIKDVLSKEEYISTPTQINSVPVVSKKNSYNNTLEKEEESVLDILFDKAAKDTYKLQKEDKDLQVTKSRQSINKSHKELINKQYEDLENDKFRIKEDDQTSLKNAQSNKTDTKKDVQKVLDFIVDKKLESKDGINTPLQNKALEREDENLKVYHPSKGTSPLQYEISSKKDIQIQLLEEDIPKEYNQVNLQRSKNKEDIFESQDSKEEQTLIPGGIYVGNHHNTYIIYENQKGLFLIDQHAAQERIRYEMIISRMSKKKYKYQKVLIPQTFDFTQDEFIEVLEKIEDLANLGLIFEKFGPNTLRLVEIDNSYLKVKNMKKQIRWIVDTIVEEKKLSYAQIVDEIAISMACKGSIKAHDYITQDDAKALLLDLSKCIEPYTCPHGRPIIVNIDNYQIQKMFKRVN